jgi:Flp pilus assembly pilin Flp
MLSRFLFDETGLMVAEYALLLAIFCAGITCAAVFLGDAISAAIVHAGNTISAEVETIKREG